MNQDEVIVELAEEELVETWGDSLEGQAKEIVESESPRLCVQAGPGTGKSFCMTRRLLRLIQQKRVQPHQILAVTFTRTAATDLRKALEGTLGEKYRSFRASTLHSLCFNIVEEQRFLEVRQRNPRFLLTVTKAGCLNFEAAPMLSDLKAENADYKGAREQSKQIKEYEAMWAKQQADPLGTPGDGLVAAYGTSLLNWLKFHKGMLVGELVKEAYEFMSAEPDSLWRKKFKAILVDEYQDLNKLDQSLIDLLCQEADTIASVVGDLDQSIYSFRCAHPEGLQEYAAKDGVEARTMEKSRRCPTTHLSAAQNLIAQNTKKATEYPTALPDAKAGEISVRRWADRETEVAGVVSFVQHCIAQGVEAGEILVMVPSRVIGKDIRRALNTAGVEAQSYFAEEQLEDEGAQKAFTLLTLLANKNDRISLRTWLGAWSTNHRSGSYKKLRDYCEANNVELWSTLEAVSKGELQIAGITALTTSFTLLLTELDKLKDLKGTPLLDAIFPEDAEWAEDIRVLAADSLTDETTATELHETLVDSITQPVMPTEVSHVRVMSLHKSKGLTARASVIAGAVEGLIPRPYDADKSFLTASDHTEEQRRLFYVAMTRSTEYMLICSPVLVDLQFAYGYQLPGARQGAQYRTTVSSFVTSLGQPTLPMASNTMVFP